jgi:hypothetical protein
MLAGLGGTLRMRAYQMDEHAGHALAVWRPFNTCLERHSRMNVLLTEISCGRRSEGWRTRRWLLVCDGLGGKHDGNGFGVSTWESEEKASSRGRLYWVLAVRSSDDW